MTFRPFTITVNRDLNTVLAEARRKAAEKGIKHSGDTNQGQFTGWGLNAIYTVSGNQVTIHIHSLPITYDFDSTKQAIIEYFQ